MGRVPRLARRTFLGVGASGAAAAAATSTPGHYQFGYAPSPLDRLDQGPFDVDQDQGWRTLATTTPSTAHVRNYGLGLVGYTWEENGPSVPARKGLETLPDAVE